MRRRRPASGFSLLELLVALAILGLVLGTVYRAATGATRNVAVSERYSFAILLAESLLADYGSRMDPGSVRSGDSGGYTWRVSSEALPEEAGDPVVLQRVSATVGWEGGGSRQVELHTFEPVVSSGDAE